MDYEEMYNYIIDVLKDTIASNEDVLKDSNQKTQFCKNLKATNKAFQVVINLMNSCKKRNEIEESL